MLFNHITFGAENSKTLEGGWQLYDCVERPNGTVRCDQVKFTNIGTPVRYRNAIYFDQLGQPLLSLTVKKLK